MITFPAG